MLALQDRINCDVGNHAVTVISLLFLRLQVYAVNARMVPWRDRAVYSWITLVWFTSFHTSRSTIMINKQNMLLETVGILFLVARDDVFHMRQNTSEYNNTHLGCGELCHLHVSSIWINSSVLCRRQISEPMLSLVAS